MNVANFTLAVHQYKRFQKSNNVDTCAICGQDKELTFEHIPPKSCSNTKITYQLATLQEIGEALGGSIKKNVPLNRLQGKRIYQGGIGVQSICSSCNNYAGDYYVRSYGLFYKELKKQLFETEGVVLEPPKLKIRPLPILKEILFMFSALSPDLVESFPSIKDFLLNKENQDYPTDLKVYMYATKSNSTRYLKWPYFVNQAGKGLTTMSEIVLPPFGFLLASSISYIDPRLLELSSFKDYSLSEEKELTILMNILPVETPFPMDYRNRSEIF